MSRASSDRVADGGPALTRIGRADEAGEGPFPGPERLALALPLTAALGLTMVMAAAALGQSTPIVTLAAAAGFALCAFAPMALLQAYVGRPLRAALAHLRAARDGAEPPGAPPAPGVIADLVAVARDIRGAHANIGHSHAGVRLCEKMAAAGDEALRAFRLQCEELAETTVQGESQLRRAAQDQFAEIAEALKTFKTAAPSRALDAGVERIEQMLVYLAETLEGRAKPPEGGDRVESALTEIVRLIGREGQAISDTFAIAALTARNDIAGAVAPDAARVLDAIRAEAETTRRALRDHAGASPETGRLADAMTQTVARLDAAVETLAQETLAHRDAPALHALSEAVANLGARWDGAAPPAVMRGFGDVAERLREQGQAQTARFDEFEARLVKQGERERENLSHAVAVLAKSTDKLRNALDRFDVLSAAAANGATGQDDHLRAAFRALEGEVAALGDRLVQGVAALDFPALRQDFATLGARVEASGEAQAERLGAFETGPLAAASGAMSAFADAQERTFEVLRAEMAEVAPRVGAFCEGLARRLDTLDAKSLQSATRDLAAVQARCESFARQISLSAAALAALAEREGHDFEGLRSAVKRF